MWNELGDFSQVKLIKVDVMKAVINLEGNTKRVAFELVKKKRLRAHEAGNHSLAGMESLPYSPHASSFPGIEPVVGWQEIQFHPQPSPSLLMATPSIHPT